MNGYRSILSLVVCVMLTTAVQVYAQQYTVTDLGALLPVAVIDGPTVFGNLAGEPVVWQDGMIFPLQHVGHGGHVYGANNRGDAVGWVWLPVQGTLTKVASFWYPDGTVTLLPGSGETEARGLNMDRTIVGRNLTNGNALRWQPGDLEENLGFGSIAGVDALGQAWGQQSIASLTTWGVDGMPRVYNSGLAQLNVRAVNPSGVAVGTPKWNNAIFRFDWGNGGTLVPANPPSGQSADCEAAGINARGTIVGWCHALVRVTRHALLWTPEGEQVVLDSFLDGSFRLALAISDDGHIVGTTGGQGWLLSPIAQPPAVALHMNRGDFRPGESWQVSIEREGGPADLHVAIILPDGITTLFLTNIQTLSYIVSTIARGPYPLTAGQALAYQWHGLEPHGTYHIVAALARPGSLQDGRIDQGDIVALDWKAFSFTGELIAGR